MVKITLLAPSAILILSLLASMAANAKDCEIEIQYRSSNTSLSTKISVAGVNKGNTSSVTRNNVRYLKNKKGQPVEAEISKTPGSSQTRWVILYAKNQKYPTTGYFAQGVNLFKVRCPTTTSTAAVSNPSSCPVGSNGKICSGTGVCSANSGQCNCAEDYSGNACQTLTQRCYGAIGNNCGVGDGIPNFGLCARGICRINAGSWAHDECCVTYRKNGPAPSSQQGSCTPPPFAGAPYANNCLVLFQKAVDDLKSRALTWERRVDFSKRSSGTESFSVNHADMCNKPGGTLACSDTQYCCSRRAIPIVPPGICKCL